MNRFLQPNHPFSPCFYTRYVDDTFVLFNTLTQATEFLDYINNLHPNISFTMETEHNSSLNFLDVLVTRQDGTFHTSVFRKRTFTGQGLNFQSFSYRKFKVNAISTLIFRAYHISSTFLYFHSEILFLHEYFKKLGYPSHIFWLKVRKFLWNIYAPPVRFPDVPKLMLYASLPFLGPINRSFEK